MVMLIRPSNAQVMPLKTFAHGRAIRLAMDRLRYQRGIIIERTNERMFVEERQR